MLLRRQQQRWISLVVFAEPLQHPEEIPTVRSFLFKVLKVVQVVLVLGLSSASSRARAGGRWTIRAAQGWQGPPPPTRRASPGD